MFNFLIFYNIFIENSKHIYFKYFMDSNFKRRRILEDDEDEALDDEKPQENDNSDHESNHDVLNDVSGSDVDDGEDLDDTWKE